ncbi:MAG: hypothetical protein ACU0GG_16915 [Paracoccaceae bacterium]
MFSSSADVFRTRQAVADLLEVVHLHRNAVPRIGASGAEVESLERIVQNRGRIPEKRARSYTSILLAAAMPDEDFNAFIAATALLLTDLLQDGTGSEDLYWNYEAFKDHYLLADAPVRAALMCAFRTALQTGKATLPDEPDESHCLTLVYATVLQVLRSENAEDLVDWIENEPDQAVAGARWVDLSSAGVPFALSVAARYLYERPISIAPEPSETATLIPWV